MSGDLKELIRAEKSFMATQPGAEHKVWAGIAHSVTHSIPPRIDIAASALGGGAKATSLLVANGKLWLAMAALGGAVGVGTVGAVAHYRSPAAVSPPTQVSQPPVTPLSQDPSAPAVAEEPSDVGSRAVPRRTAATASASSASTDSFAEELALIRKAQQELAANHPDAALATLRDHRRQFVTSQFAEDRSALTALALCSSGRLAEGRAQAQRLIHRAPTSIYVDRLHATCGIPKP